MQAEKHLFATTPFLGAFLRKRAVERLFSGNSREAALELAGAVENGHPEADAIIRRLLRLQHGSEPVMYGALWNCWKSRRFEELLNRTHASETLLQDLLRAIEAMPETDWGNGMVFTIWSLLDRDDIAEKIEAKGRHAPALELDALFGLVRGNPERYLALEDPDHSIFEKAWLAATSARRQRISTTVLKSQNPRLVAAYDHAVRDGHDPQLVIEALKLCGDHDALLDRLHGLPFTSALEVVAYWEESGGRPKNPSGKAVAEAAVALYRELPGLLPELRPSRPPGARDIFSFWTERYGSGELLEQDLSSPDPFRRAGALFAGAQRGSVPRSRLQEITLNGAWPEKLALHYLVAAPEAGSRHEHVSWLRPQDNIVAAILATRLPGSPEESSMLMDRLHTGAGPADRSAGLQRKLLQLLGLLQGYFLRGLITVDSSDDATEKTAVETEEMTDMEW
ncbi:conserved hypothetical protein [Chlorobium limicola DSM 245]|uniref:Uncharacterized protein n=1 Tax=Chlorobium limicola (strain DSM 245 / NBRC 103803 / 6330) TaxID=290315 RepID=B3EC28_CHLL2|nr:hypothetical protein [Chlorobium limicola]ACD90103.1 conserved hypothetical protein [Chlorobium limicola DSM 245]